MKGERPGVLLGDDLILLDYTAMRGKQKVAELVCFDLEGRQLWVRPGGSGLLALGGNRFLVQSPENELQIINDSGRTIHRSSIGGVNEVSRHGDLLVLATERHIWATDPELHPVWQFTWPGASSLASACFTGGLFYWVEEDQLKLCTRGGLPQTICRLPEVLVAEAMNRYERTTGCSALAGWYSTRGSDFRAFQIGDRPHVFNWRVSFDEKTGQFFLSNCIGPHLLLCIDNSGRPRWCEYLSCGCCGGTPYALPNGLYVVSSGCGAILSWLDGGGHILFQSRPHEGVGLATAYSSELRILPDGRVLADGGSGILAYSSWGEQLWSFQGPYSRFHYDSASGILVGCYWQNERPDNTSKTYLELAGGL